MQPGEKGEETPVSNNGVVSNEAAVTPTGATTDTQAAAAPAETSVPAPSTPEAEPTSSASVPAATESEPTTTQTTVVPTPAKKKRRGLLALLIVAGGLLLLGGGGAAAYLGVIVPNKPENVLKTAMEHMIVDTSSYTIDAKITAKSEGTDLDMAFKVATDATTKASNVNLSLQLYGITIPVESRFVDGKMYAKVGSLDSIVNLLSLSGDTNDIEALLDKVSNQWIVLDEEVVKDANINCLTDATKIATTQADFDELSALYETQQFTEIKSTAADTVNGKAATKFELELQNKQGAAFAQGVLKTNMYKRLSSCLGDTLKDLESTKTADVSGVTPLSMWVDKESKRIVKVAGKTSAQDMTASGEATIAYTAEKITKPENAKSAESFIAELEDDPVVKAYTSVFLNSLIGNLEGLKL